MLYTRFVQSVITFSCFCLSLGIPVIEAIPLIERRSTESTAKVHYPQKPSIDLIPLYFFTCASIADSIANGNSFKDATPYGTAFKFQLPIESSSVSTSKRVLRYLLYNPSLGIPADAKPTATCLENHAVVGGCPPFLDIYCSITIYLSLSLVIEFHLAHPDADIEDLVGIPQLSHKVLKKAQKPQDPSTNTISDNRDIIILPYEQEKKIVTAVLLNDIVASPPTLRYVRHSAGRTPEAAWLKMKTSLSPK
ncbi:hypothetical protein DFJ43DRAFT_1070052 [Lentinula guzmanii]|uniref:Uncharacterized protein n=1 Tax=Lentinula guzmanii TaxID=2804957 RepID=A0AA38JLP7_9AGAR|nr:hypothetical protein DFJ43DRAFT_1070052 [Lentinula guzmanii]